MHYGTFYSVVDHKGEKHKPVQVWTGDYVNIQFGTLKNNPPFSDETKRLEILHRLNQIPGISIPNNAIDKYPSIALTKLRSESSLRQFLKVLDWVISEIKLT